MCNTEIKAIVTTKKKLLFFDVVDRIYFDTYGRYPFLKEAEDKCDLIIHNGVSLIWLIHKGISLSGFINDYGDSIINFNDKNRIIHYTLNKIKDNVYSVKFDNTLFTYEQIFYITDKILRNIIYIIRF